MSNTSGWFPLLHRVLVKPEETELEKLEKKSGLIISGLETVREEQAQVTGTVVAAGPEVFSDKPNSRVPQEGDVVMFAKLAGFFVKGADGQKYRMINDLDIVAIKGYNKE